MPVFSIVRQIASACARATTAKAWDSTASAFSPTDISGLTLWLDASDISTLYQDAAKTTPVASDGDPVGAWADLSGNGNDVTQSTASAKPTYKTGIKNGLSVLRGDSGDYLQGAFSASIAQPNTIFAISESSLISAGKQVIDGDDASNRNVIQWNPVGTPGDYYRINAGNNLNVANSLSDSVWHLLTAFFNGASSGGRLDGVAGNSGDAGSQAMDGATVLAKYDGTIGHDKDIGEILVYNGLVSGDDLSNLENYLANKWGITI